MNKVTPVPVLPQSVTAPTFMASLLAVLKSYATSINQGADGRLLLSKAVTTTYTAGENDHVIIVTPAAPFTVTLPDVAQMVGKMIHIKRANSTAHTITIATVAGLIDGAATTSLTTTYQSRSIYSDGTSYHLIT